MANWRDFGSVLCSVLCSILLSVLVLGFLSGLASAQQISPSEPAPLPVPEPAPVIVAEDIPDLTEAPPVTIAAILRIINLGAYPLTADMRALPNQPASTGDAAFMLVNLFAPDANGEFPVPAESAVAYLNGRLETPFDPATPLVGTGALELLSAVLTLTPEDEIFLRSSLAEQFPAFAAGNFGAPLTRAALALFSSQALDLVATFDAAPAATGGG